MPCSARLRSAAPADVDAYNRFLASSKEIFEKGMALIDQPFLNLSDMLSVVPDLIRLQSYRSVYGYVSKFFQDDFLRCCFSFQPLLIGGNPLTAASIYVLIHYLEREWGHPLRARRHRRHHRRLRTASSRGRRQSPPQC